MIIGHGRLLAAKKLKYEEVPCVRAEDLTDEQVKALRLADNKTNESDWDGTILNIELEEIKDIDMSDYGFDIPTPTFDEANETDDNWNEDDRDPSCQHNAFENQDLVQFPIQNYYGIPEMQSTNTIGDKLWRFMDWRDCENPSEYIVHFYYDDYKFIQAWRTPDKYIERLRQYKAVISPDFSLYTDFPRSLQILACYRRQWVGAYWQMQGLDVIPDVVWGDEESFNYCFEGIPKGGTVAVSTVGVWQDKDWNNSENALFKKGYDEMMRRIEPSTVILYGSEIDGLDGNIIRVPSYYEERRNKWGAEEVKQEQE